MYGQDIHVPQSHTGSKKNGKDQESIQLSTTPDPGYQWESDNFTLWLQFFDAFFAFKGYLFCLI